MELLKEWQIDHKIIGLLFDTTASNTGVHRGAAILLEQELTTPQYDNPRLLLLGCRHHVDELLTCT